MVRQANSASSSKRLSVECIAGLTGGSMPIYIVRLNDGSCLIGEADSDVQAGEELVSRWEADDTQPLWALSVRELPKGTFLSQWSPSNHPATAGYASQLEGVMNDEADIFEKEYPIIAALHKRASEELAGISDGASDEDHEDWEARHEKNLRAAVQAEMFRGNRQTESLQ